MGVWGWVSETGAIYGGWGPNLVVMIVFLDARVIQIEDMKLIEAVERHPSNIVFEQEMPPHIRKDNRSVRPIEVLSESLHPN